MKFLPFGSRAFVFAPFEWFPVFFQLFLSSFSPQSFSLQNVNSTVLEKKECGVQHGRSSQHSFPLNFLLPPSLFLLKVVVCTSSAPKITFLGSHPNAEPFPLKLFGGNDARRAPDSNLSSRPTSQCN